MIAPPAVTAYVGLVLYTFSNLLQDGLAVARLLEQWPLTFPDLPLVTFKSVALSEQKRKSAVTAKPISWRALRTAVLNGEVARFDASSKASKTGDTAQIRFRLSAATNGHAEPNHMIIRLPLEPYSSDRVKARNLIDLGVAGFAALQAAYGYGGLRITSGSSNALNEAINASIDKVPLGDFFDINIAREFQERIKGAFWANFLNGNHVETLGGIEKVRMSAPCQAIEPLADGGLLLLLAPTPVWDNEDKMAESHRALRHYLGPVISQVKPNQSGVLDVTGFAQRVSYNT